MFSTDKKILLTTINVRLDSGRYATKYYLQALLLFYHACFHNAWFSKTHAARSNYANSANTHKKDFISIKQCANSVQTQSQYH